MKLRALIPVAAAAAMLLSACAAMAPASVKLDVNTLVTAGGMSLYTFDNDKAGSGKSVCNGPCAKNWPPLMVSAGETAAENWAIVIRDDSSRQWAYKGKPLYTWIKDAKPGDMTGDGFNKVWHIAKP
jgi:predicted lipoprotein with Yx(FWY)xxD motif